MKVYYFSMKAVDGAGLLYLSEFLLFIEVIGLGCKMSRVGRLLSDG
jgi:hypothetical protein